MSAFCSDRLLCQPCLQKPSPGWRMAQNYLQHPCNRVDLAMMESMRIPTRRKSAVMRRPRRISWIHSARAYSGRATHQARRHRPARLVARSGGGCLVFAAGAAHGWHAVRPRWCGTRSRSACYPRWAEPRRATDATQTTRCTPCASSSVRATWASRWPRSPTCKNCGKTAGAPAPA